MKTCPICKARCFDDMEICYGCMHRFEEDLGNREVPVEDITGLDQMPLRPNTMSNDPAPANADSRAVAKRASRRESPRVFGAVESDERVSQLQATTKEDGIRRGMPSPVDVGWNGVPYLEPVVGPLAVAPLGDGYCLVVTIERE